MVEVTATLDDWHYDGAFHIMWGRCLGDTKGRFTNGEWIRTSWLRHSKDEVPNFKEGDLVHTRNSVYKLGKKGGTE